MNQSLLVYEIRPSLSSTNTRSQVVVGFMLSAYLTLTVVIVHYFVGKRISENPIDRWLTRRFRSSTPAKQSGKLQKHGMLPRKRLFCCSVTHRSLPAWLSCYADTHSLPMLFVSYPIQWHGAFLEVHRVDLYSTAPQKSQARCLDRARQML